MPQQSNLTKEQIAEIQRLSGVLDHKTVARRIGCTPSQVKHFWRMIDRSGRLQVHKLAPEAQSLFHQSARAALRREIELAKAERATAPIFRIRPEEWATA